MALARAMSWRVAKSLITLRDQLDRACPARDKASDGAVGDAGHASRASDHNPWHQVAGVGVVTAIDLTHDPEHGADMHRLAAHLVSSRDARVKYVIWDRKIWRSYPKPGLPAWSPEPYRGTNPHTKHLHLSVQPAHCDDTRPWGYPPPRPIDKEDDVPKARLVKLGDNVYYLRPDGDRVHVLPAELERMSHLVALGHLASTEIVPLDPVLANRIVKEVKA